MKPLQYGDISKWHSVIILLGIGFSSMKFGVAGCDAGSFHRNISALMSSLATPVALIIFGLLTFIGSDIFKCLRSFLLARQYLG